MKIIPWLVSINVIVACHLTHMCEHKTLTLYDLKRWGLSILATQELGWDKAKMSLILEMSNKPNLFVTDWSQKPGFHPVVCVRTECLLPKTIDRLWQWCNHRHFGWLIWSPVYQWSDFQVYLPIKVKRCHQLDGHEDFYYSWGRGTVVTILTLLSQW